MVSRKLSKADLEKIKPWAETMVERFELDDVEDVMTTIQDKYEEFSKRPKFETKPKVFILNRAKSAANIKYTGIGNLERMLAVFLGPGGRPKNWTEEDYNKVLEAAAKGSQADVMQMAKERKIASIKEARGEGDNVREIRIPVRKILGNGRLVKTSAKPVNFEVRKWLDEAKTVPGYELWTPGDPVIPLDTDKYLSADKKKPVEERRENWNHTNVLLPNWGVTIYALIWRGDQAMPHIAQIKVYGDAADPNNKGNIIDYFGSRGLWLHPVHFKAEFNEDKSSGEHWEIRVTRDKWAVKPLKGKEIEEFDMYEKGYEWAYEPDFTGDPFDGGIAVPTQWEGDLPPPFGICDLEHLREWHEKIQTIYNSSGDAYKSYDRVGMMECTIMAQAQPEDGNSIKISIKDNSLQKTRFSAFLPSIFSELPFAGAADALIWFTSKKGKKWKNPATGEWEEDKTGTKASINIGLINMLILMEHDEGDGEDDDVEEVDVVDEDAENEVRV